jgi:hypothetical protein
MGQQDLTGRTSGSSAESVPAGEEDKRMDLAIFTASASLPLLPPYLRFVPAKQYDWQNYRPALYVKMLTYEMGGTCNMNGAQKKRYKILVGKFERKNPV